MTTDSAHRSVRLERIENSRYVVTNDRGGQISIGKGEGTDFTPVDLLLAGIGGCTAVDVDILTSRRAEPDAFEVLVDAEKVRDDAGNRLTDIVVTFRIRFPDGERGDAARALLPGCGAQVARPAVHGEPDRGTRHTHRDPDRVLAVPAEAPGGEGGTSRGPEGQVGQVPGWEGAHRVGVLQHLGERLDRERSHQA